MLTPNDYLIQENQRLAKENARLKRILKDYEDTIVPRLAADKEHLRNKVFTLMGLPKSVIEEFGADYNVR